MRLPFLFLLALLFCPFQAKPQSQVQDSVFSAVSFLEGVLKNHPLVRQTRLADDLAKAEIQQARGQFDPKAETRFLRKTWDGKDYYNLFNPEIKIPTLPGMDVKAGFERNAGSNVNEEDKTPSGGLRYLGIQLPLARGLLTDGRRNALKLAGENRKLAAADIRKSVNKLLYEAGKDYWDWYQTHFQLKNSTEALRLAGRRYEAVRQRIRIGELPKIDSLEAWLFVQDRQSQLNQSLQDEQNARARLSTWLWSDEGEPAELLSGSVPAIPEDWKVLFPQDRLQNWLEQAQQNHPDLQKIRVKSSMLELDKKLAAEMLKPSLNLQYNWLSGPDAGWWTNAPMNRNYKLGADFSMPVFLRKERGKLSLVKTKILQNKLEQDQAVRDLRAEISIAGNQLLALSQNLNLQKTMVENYEKLLQAEIRKFGIGESSLFLINSRESKLIEARMKLVSLESKFQKERAGLIFAAGRHPLQAE